MRATLDLEKGFLIRPSVQKTVESLDAIIKEFDPPIVNIEGVDGLAPFVREVHLRGRLAFVNTMGKTDGKESIERAIDAGADYVQSDQLDMLMQVLRARGLHK